MDIIDNPVEIFPVNYKEAVQTQCDFYIQFAVYTHEVESQLMKMFRSFLSRYDILYSRDIIVTIIKELITNAVKANAKRLYFQNRGLSINDPQDYEKGMINFKKDVLFENSEVIQQMAKTNLRVRVLFISDNGALRVKVINNITTVPNELSKIEARIKRAYEYNDITQALLDTLDDSEGAGLGLTMAILVFKNAGYSPSDFTVTCEGSKTISSVTIYQRPNRKELELKITDEILKELDALPSFPEHIKKIEQSCDNQDISILDIASLIKQDVALSTTLLKLANSAGYITSRRTETIEDASKIIGIKGIKTLLIASGVQQIIEARYNKYRELWVSSNRKAFYAHAIALQLKNQSISETAYLGALLSEIGRIVLLSVKPEVIESIARIAGLRDPKTIDMLEEMTLGISHPTLGSLIAKKWQFSESLIRSIEYYLRPYISPPEYTDIVFTIHLAHVFIEIERKKMQFEMIDDEILDYFHLSHKETFEKLHTILKQSYMSKAPV
jgi:HD-like signal output (HDOD) protein